jgi:hypothetical protein
MIDRPAEKSRLPLIQEPTPLAATPIRHGEGRISDPQ